MIQFQFRVGNMCRTRHPKQLMEYVTTGTLIPEFIHYLETPMFIMATVKMTYVLQFFLIRLRHV